MTIELSDERDRQDAVAPPRVAVHWLAREARALPGTAVRPWQQGHNLAEGTPYAFAVGESALATGARRHLVTQRGVPKANVTFSGYWRLGRAAG